MKIEKLSKSNAKRGFVIGFGVCILLVVIINLFTSKSKYKVDDNIDLAEGTINYVIPNLKLMAVYVKEGEEFVKKDTVPSDTTYQVVKGEGENTSYCVDLDGNKIDNVYMKYHEGKILIDVNKKGTKCWIYLEKATLLNEDILAKNPPKESIYNETYPHIAEFTSTSTTDEGVYKMADYDGEPTYYFRGAVEDNYVHFANFYWRIIRINSDGSIRMIYDGTSAHPNGEANEDRQTGESTYNDVNNDTKNVGFMYGSAAVPTQSYADANKNEIKSTILTGLEAWYKDNLLKYDSYIEKDAIFCNDRRSTDNYIELWTEWLDAGAKNVSGFGAQNATAYGSRMRVDRDSDGWQKVQYVDLSCQVNDRFTSEDAKSGNKAMQYPIGLITLNEVLMGGGLGGQYNDKYYLYTGQCYWTMSPEAYSSVYYGSLVFRVEGIVEGWQYLTSGWVNNIEGVRPVINLKANTTFSKGDGSIDSPYEIL